MPSCNAPCGPCVVPLENLMRERGMRLHLPAWRLEGNCRDGVLTIRVHADPLFMRLYGITKTRLKRDFDPLRSLQGPLRCVVEIVIEDAPVLCTVQLKAETLKARRQ